MCNIYLNKNIWLIFISKNLINIQFNHHKLNKEEKDKYIEDNALVDISNHNSFANFAKLNHKGFSTNIAKR